MSSAWVIGGTSGIGEAVANKLRFAHGILVLAEGQEEFDVRSPMTKFCDKVKEVGWWSRHHDGTVFPSMVVYAAGVNHLDWVENSAATDMHLDVIDVNLNGFIKLVSAMSDSMSSRAAIPSIVAISSDAAERPLRTSIGYCASKAGLNQAVRVAARELGPYGWRINVVAPGMTDGTGMTEYIDEAVPRVRGWDPNEALRYEMSQEVVRGRIPRGDVADVIIQTLTGPAHLNGSIITLNGGR